MFESLFPLGINHYVLGGVLVGIGISIPYLFTGIVSGVSTVFTSTWSYLFRGPFFQRPEFVASRVWRITLALGLVTGGLLYMVYLNGGETTLTDVSSLRLLLGGLLIGIGTRMGGGCASGHGIMGNASLSKASLVATVIFLGVGILTAQLTAAFLF